MLLEKIKEGKKEGAEVTTTLKLDKDFSIRQLIELLNDNNIKNMVKRVYKKVGDDKVQTISRTTIKDDYFSYDYPTILIINNSNADFIKFNNNQEFKFILDDMNWLDVFVNIEYEELVISYHIVLTV